MRSIGVEEDFLLVDADREVLAPVATRVLQVAAARGHTGGGSPGRAAIVYEMQEQQLELYTSPHTSMSSLEAELRTRAAVRDPRP